MKQGKKFLAGSQLCENKKEDEGYLHKIFN